MKHMTRRTIIFLFTLALLGLTLFLRARALPEDPASTGFYAQQGLLPQPAAQVTQTAEETDAGTDTAPVEEPAFEERDYLISVIGDNTLASHQFAGASVSYAGRMGEDYAYPYSNTVQYFESDDFTIANLECTFSDQRLYSGQQFHFLAPTAYANILLEGGVDFVTTANNHMLDFGQQGLDDTCAALDAYGIPYGRDGQSQILDLPTGLRVGIYTAYNNYVPNKDKAAAAVRQLREDGAEYVICMFHWGQELHYTPNKADIDLAHICCDAGADLVYGSHSHCLQPIEKYGNGVILYSCGNWVFGGNTMPSDPDTAIFQVRLSYDEEGRLTPMGFDVIPCCVSSNIEGANTKAQNYNNYCPTPYETDSEEYMRVMSKLYGEYQPASQGADYSDYYASLG